MSLIILYGRPGVGKTTMATTMTKSPLNYHLKIVDMDKKAQSQANVVPLIKEGKVSVNECPEPLDRNTLKQLAIGGIGSAFPKALPKGYLWLADQLDALNDPELPNCSNTVLMIDSLTAVNRHMKNLIRFHAKSAKLGFDGWDTILQNYQHFFEQLREMTPNVYPHIIVTAHAKDDKDETIQMIESRPLVDGSFREEMGSYSDEMYFLEVDTAGKMGRAKFWAITKPVDRIKHARSAFCKETRVEQDFTKIIKESSP